MIDCMIDCMFEAVRTNPGYGMVSLIHNFWDFWELFLSLQGSSTEFLCIQNRIYDSEFLKSNITIIFGLTSYHILMWMFILLL